MMDVPKNLCTRIALQAHGWHGTARISKPLKNAFPEICRMFLIVFWLAHLLRLRYSVFIIEGSAP
jgi:hypothetical protein